jgi:hypothetical protein
VTKDAIASLKETNLTTMTTTITASTSLGTYFDATIDHLYGSFGTMVFSLAFAIVTSISYGGSQLFAVPHLIALVGVFYVTWKLANAPGKWFKPSTLHFVGAVLLTNILAVAVYSLMGIFMVP